MSHWTGHEENGHEENGYARLRGCGDRMSEGQVIENGPVFGCDDREPTECPNCHKKLRLVWDVRIEEVE